MSEQAIITIIISIVPTFIMFLNERKKVNTEGASTVFDKQQLWIEKLEGELEEREIEILELKDVIKGLETRIRDLEKYNILLEDGMSECEETENPTDDSTKHTTEKE